MESGNRWWTVAVGVLAGVAGGTALGYVLAKQLPFRLAPGVHTVQVGQTVTLAADDLESWTAEHYDWHWLPADGEDRAQEESFAIVPGPRGLEVRLLRAGVLEIKQRSISGGHKVLRTFVLSTPGQGVRVTK